MAYATNTDVSVDKTQIEIKKTMSRYGATAFAFMEGAGMAMIAFQMNDRRITFKLPLPDRDDPKFAVSKATNQFTRTAEGRSQASERAWEQSCRSRWRSLFLCIKAKLESVEAGIETFEDAFLAHIQMPDGLTFSEHARPAIAHAYETGTMPPLLPGPSRPN